MHENIKMLIVWTQTILNETECPRVVNFPAILPECSPPPHEPFVLSPFSSCCGVSLVTGLEAKTGEGRSEEVQVSSEAAALGEAITGFFLDKAVEELFLLAKMTPQNFGVQGPQLHQALPTGIHSNFRILFLASHCPRSSK